VLVGLLNARAGVPPLPTDVLPTKANYNASPCQPSQDDGSGEQGGGSGEQGGSSGSDAAPRARRLRWQVLNGTENPCHTNVQFMGRYAHCYGATLHFFAEDLQLADILGQHQDV
jgi:hypothetical protein